MAGSLSVASTAVPSAEVAVVDSGEVCRSAVLVIRIGIWKNLLAAEYTLQKTSGV
jgi:hypothetical protein